jgi:hypothetical protein
MVNNKIAVKSSINYGYFVVTTQFYFNKVTLPLSIRYRKKFSCVWS